MQDATVTTSVLFLLVQSWICWNPFCHCHHCKSPVWSMISLQSSANNTLVVTLVAGRKVSTVCSGVQALVWDAQGLRWALLSPLTRLWSTSCTANMQSYDSWSWSSWHTIPFLFTYSHTHTRELDRTVYSVKYSRICFTIAWFPAQEEEVGMLPF